MLYCVSLIVLCVAYCAVCCSLCCVSLIVLWVTYCAVCRSLWPESLERSFWHAIDRPCSVDNYLISHPLPRCLVVELLSCAGRFVVFDGFRWRAHYLHCPWLRRWRRYLLAAGIILAARLSGRPYGEQWRSSHMHIHHVCIWKSVFVDDLQVDMWRIVCVGHISMHVTMCNQTIVSRFVVSIESFDLCCVRYTCH